MALRPFDKDSGFALTFDDVLLVPGASEVMPGEVNVSSRVTSSIGVNIPIISSAMDTVTEARLAIAVAQAGGIGVIHRNLEPDVQAEQVRQVKKFEAGIVLDPITIAPDSTLDEAFRLMAENDISGIPVVEPNGRGDHRGQLVGILTNRDVRFATSMELPVSELMTKDRLVTVKRTVTQEEARRLLHQYRIEKLLVVDDDYRCVGLITVKDIEKAEQNPTAATDEKGRLQSGGGDDGRQGRTTNALRRLIAAGCDLIVVDTAHGHSRRVLEAVSRIKKTVQQHAGGSRQRGDRGCDARVDRCRCRCRQGRHRAWLDLYDAYRRGRRRAAAYGNHGLRRGSPAKHGIPIIADGGVKVLGRCHQGAGSRGQLRDDRLAACRHGRKSG